MNDSVAKLFSQIDSLLSSYVLVYSRAYEGGEVMAMVKLLISVSEQMKAKLDAERKRGTSAAGLIRHLLEQYFKGKKAA